MAAELGYTILDGVNKIIELLESSFELLHSDEVTVNTSSTSAVAIKTISIENPNTPMLVVIRDKAGKRIGYAFGSDNIVCSIGTSSAIGRVVYGVSSVGKINLSSSTNGVYISSVGSGSAINLYVSAKYNASYGTIDGTFKIDIYKITYPDGINPLEPISE